MANVVVKKPTLTKLYTFNQLKVGALGKIYSGDFAGFYVLKVANCDYDEPILVELTGHNYWKEEDMADFGANIELIESGTEIRIMVDD